MSWLSDLDAFAVENPAGPGTPDVCYVEGWIELKQLDRWPVRATTPVRIPHYTSQQRIRATRRWEKGGNVFWLLQIKNDWLLLDGDVAADLYTGGSAPTRAILFDKARMTWHLGHSTVRKELRYYLCRTANDERRLR